MCNFYRGGKKVAILLAVLLTGCSPKVVRTEVPVPITNTTHSETVKVVRDTVRLHERDSVFTFVKGDTVRIERWHYQIDHQRGVRVDTVVRCDTITKPVTVTKTVTQPLTKWQKAKMRAGGAAMVLCCIAAAAAIVAVWWRKKI